MTLRLPENGVIWWMNSTQNCVTWLRSNPWKRML